MKTATKEKYVLPEPKVPDDILNVWSHAQPVADENAYDFSITSQLKWGKGASCNLSVPSNIDIKVKKEILTSKDSSPPHSEDTSDLEVSKKEKNSSGNKSSKVSHHTSSKKI